MPCVSLAQDCVVLQLINNFEACIHFNNKQNLKPVLGLSALASNADREIPSSL